MAGAVALFSLSNAQIKRGTVYISGEVGYTQEKDNNKEYKSQVFKAIPTVGVFVAPNLAVGTGIGYINSKFESTQINFNSPSTFIFNSTSTETAFVVAPFVRKYWTLSDKLYIFGQLEIPVKFSTRNIDSDATFIDSMYGEVYYRTMSFEQKYTSVGVNIKPGLDYFVNKNWSLEATIGEFGYRNFKMKDQEKGSNNFNFGVNLSSVTFGVKYVFVK